MTKTQLFDLLISGKTPEDRTLFRPILMHFAARFAGKTYGEFASDYKTLVNANIKAMEYFDLDMVGLISDPYRETSAFGAKVSFPAEAVSTSRAALASEAAFPRTWARLGPDGQRPPTETAAALALDR